MLGHGAPGPENQDTESGKRHCDWRKRHFETEETHTLAIVLDSAEQVANIKKWNLADFVCILQNKYGALRT